MSSQLVSASVLQLFVIGLLAAIWITSAQKDPNFIFQGETVPDDTIRIIALGTGTPSIARSQVATSYLIQLGSTRNVLFDAGTGSIANLYATGVDLNTIDTVWHQLAAPSGLA